MNSRRRAPAYRTWRFRNSAQGKHDVDDFNILCTDDWMDQSVDYMRFEKRNSRDRANRKRWYRQEGIIRFLIPRTENWIINSLDVPRRYLKLFPMDDSLTIFDLNNLFLDGDLYEDPTTEDSGKQGAVYDSRSGIKIGFDFRNVRSFVGNQSTRQHQTWGVPRRNEDY